MKGSTVSRRVSEFVGVALFAAALIWIISLGSYEPDDPVWFFSAGLHAAPANFAGRVGAFLAELSFQLAGYAAYMIPAVMVVVGWHYFWCRQVDAAGTKIAGTTLLFSCISTFLGLVVGTITVSGKPFRAGGYLGQWLAAELSEYLNRTGSIIVIMTLIFLAIIMSTQFSFGRFFRALFHVMRRWRRSCVRGVRQVARRSPQGKTAARSDRQAREEEAAPAPEIKVAGAARLRRRAEDRHRDARRSSRQWRRQWRPGQSRSRRR